MKSILLIVSMLIIITIYDGVRVKNKNIEITKHECFRLKYKFIKHADAG